MTPSDKKGDHTPKIKKLSNPTSTGGGGSSFESRVQASRLLMMCLGAPVPGAAEGRVIELKFQARIHGHHTDDLVCIIEGDDGKRRRSLLQMKRSLAARVKDKAFSAFIAAAWADYKNSTVFDRGSDSIFIVYDNASAAAMKGAATVCDWARYSATAGEFFNKVGAENFSNTANRNALAAIRKIVEACQGEPVDDNDLYDFATHLTFFPQDLDQDGTAEHTGHLHSILYAVALAGERANAQEVWSALVTACMEANAAAGTVTFDNLEMFIGQRLNSMFAVARGFYAAPFSVNSSAPSNADTRPERTDALMAELTRLAGLVESLNLNGIQAKAQDQLPAARECSANQLISSQLDGAHSRIKELKYRDAFEDLARIGQSLGQFDAHQQARWYLLRGTCKWHLEGTAPAADDFIRAAEICDDDDKFLAARIRGMLLRGDAAAAAAAGAEALKTFPESLAVWQATVNARINLGDALTPESIPSALQKEPDAWQMLAWSRQKQGDNVGAVAAAFHALGIAPPTYFTRDTALSVCLDKAAGDAVSMAFRMLNDEDRRALERCTAAFTPREELLWSIQSPEVVAATATNLATAYLVLSQPSVALEVLREARSHSIESPHFLRVEFEGLASTGCHEQALALGKPLIESLPKEALITYAQLAYESDDYESIERCIKAAQDLQPHQPGLIRNLSAMRWAIQAKVDAAGVLAAIEGIDWTSIDSIPELVAVAQILRNTKRTGEAGNLLERAVALLSNTTESGERYLVAQALLLARNLEQATAVYEQITPLGKHSQLHADLMLCYLRTGRRAKAKQLVDAFPPNWELHENTRHLAMELGQLTGDWELLSKLVAAELAQAPGKASSWLFKAMVVARTATEEVAHAIKDTPLELVGSTRELTRLASLELRHGYKERALARLYIMRRRRLDSTEVASAHFIAHLAVTDDLPHMEEELPAFVPGTSVTVIDTLGETMIYTLDPPGLPALPPTPEFLLPGSEEAAVLLGRGVGAEIELPDGHGQNKVLVVRRVCSAYRRLLELSQIALDSPLTQSPAAKKVRVLNEETGATDFSELTNQLRRFSEHATKSVEVYASSPITLGGLGRILGRDVIDVVRGWRTEGTPLLVSGGNPHERDKLIATLEAGKGPYLIDGATLVELATLKCLDVLTALPHVLVTSHTRDLVEGKLTEALTERTEGTAFEHEGQLGFVEVTQADREREIRFFRSIADVVVKYCRVVPAYGTDAITSTAVQLERAISTEEHSVVLAAAEYKATLISLDGRLRFLAAALGIPGIWPQVLLMYGRDKGVITQATYSLACVRQLLANRSFISVAAEDLVLMVYQGTDWLKFGLKCLKRHLSSPETEFQSALRVSLEFLARLANGGPCHVGAACRLLEQLAEALFRHKDAPKHLEILLEDAAGRVLPIDARLIRMSIRAGYVASRQQDSPGLKNVRILMCSAPPWIAVTPEDEGESTGDVSRSSKSMDGIENASAVTFATEASNSADNLFR